jgi:FG-GAP-like repeat
MPVNREQPLATVSVLLGHGDGTFQAQTPQGVFGSPSSLAIGSFNRDGRPDLAVTSRASNVLTRLSGDGLGTFYNSGTNPATGSGPESVAIADLNGDGASDLVVANFSSNTVSVLIHSCR